MQRTAVLTFDIWDVLEYLFCQVRKNWSKRTHQHIQNFCQCGLTGAPFGILLTFAVEPGRGACSAADTMPRLGTPSTAATSTPCWLRTTSIPFYSLKMHLFPHGCPTLALRWTTIYNTVFAHNQYSNWQHLNDSHPIRVTSKRM